MPLDILIPSMPLKITHSLHRHWFILRIFFCCLICNYVTSKKNSVTHGANGAQGQDAAERLPSTHGLLPASAELRTGRASLPLALTMRWLLAS